MKKPLLFLLPALFLLTAMNANAQTAGDYRSAGNGDWSAAASWQIFDGVTWISAVVPPSNLDGAITIIAGDTISVTSGSTPTMADQVVVEKLGCLKIIGSQFTVTDGPGSDLKVDGSLMEDVFSNINNDPVTFSSLIEYTGDTLFQGGGCSPDILFDGTNAQSILGQGYFRGMTLNNALNLTLLTGNSFGSVNFINGKIIATGPYVFSQYSGKFTGQDSTKFIDGKIIFIAYTHDPLSFLVPLGKGNNYLPVSFAVQKNDDIETHYNLAILDGPAPTGTLPAGVDRVSTVRYLEITSDRPENIGKATLQMGYGASDNITDTNRICIVHNVAGNWVNLGGKNKNSKTTTTVAFTTLGDFAFADKVAGAFQFDKSMPSGNIGLPDVYTRNVAQDGRLDFSLAATTGNALNLQLLDGDSATVLANLDVNGNTTGTVSKDGLAKGKYYIKIAPAGDPAGLYTYNVTGSLVVPAEASDVEPNATKATARIIVANATNTGHVGYYYNHLRDTTDWYLIKTGTASNLTLEITSKNSNAVSLTLVGKDGVTVLANGTANGNSSYQFASSIPGGGNYYAFVTSADKSQFEPYILTTTVSAPKFAAIGQPVGATEDALTANGKSTIADALIYPNPTARQFRVQLSGVVKAGGSVELSLKDINGKTVWASNKSDVSSLNSLAVDVSKLPNGTYFLAITGEDKKTITKKIIVSR